MTVIEWIGQGPGLAVLGLGLCLALVAGVLNIAILRDRYIVEDPVTVYGRCTSVGGYWLIALALGGVPWGGPDWFAVTVLLGLVVQQVGAVLLLVDRLLARWNVQPWDGRERRSISPTGEYADRRHAWARRGYQGTERRGGERRGAESRPMPLEAMTPSSVASRRRGGCG